MMRTSSVFVACVAILVGLAMTACGDSTDLSTVMSKPLPTPDVDGLEPAVRDKLLQLHADSSARPSLDLLARYARTLQAHGMNARAEEAYLRAIDLAGGGPETFELLHLAGLTTYDEHPDRAVAYLTRALALRDDFVPTFLHLAILEERLGHAESAERAYRAALDRAPSSHAHLGLGRQALAAGDARAALQHFQQALAVKPEHWEVHEAMARAYARLGQEGESKKAAEHTGDASKPTLFGDPLLARVDQEEVSFGRLCTIAQQELVRQQEGNLDPDALQQALFFVDQALRARPSAADAVFLRACILGRLQRMQDAVAGFEAVLAIEAEHLPARLYLAVALAGAGRSDEALRHVDVVLQKEPENAEALALRARLGK